ncbi:MAG: hypothetical protein ABI183_22805 [Polyangiaceae bacterium]
MRASLRGLLIATLLCGGFSAAAACTGDDTALSTFGGASIADASSTFDVIYVPVDGGPIDANVGDDSSIRPLVTVTALSDTGPVAGAVVVFYAPDGTAQPALLTNTNGMVSTTAEKGSSVTISILSIQIDGPLYDITTFTKIEPGDSLTATESRHKKIVLNDPGNVTVTSPGVVTNAAGYAYADGCDGFRLNAGGDIVLPVGSECLFNDGGTLDIFGSANATDGLTLASLETSDASYSDGGTISGLTWSPITPVALPVVGAPTGSPSSMFFAANYYLGNAIVSAFTSTTALSGTFIPPQITPPSSALLTNAISHTVLSFTGSGTSFVEQDTQAPFAAGLSVNFGSLPPRVHDAVVTNDGAGKASLSFTADGALTALDGMTSVFELTIPLADGGSANGTWTVVSPAQASTSFPVLTSELIPAFPATLTLEDALLLHGTQYGSYGVYRRAYPKIAAAELASAPYQINITGVQP